MAMVREFTLPDLGEGLTEAEIVRWLVRVGDVVAVDQPVVEVETAKAMVEVPCPYAGVVTARFGEEGKELPVGAALLRVDVGADERAGSGSNAGSGAGSNAGAGAAVGAGSAPAAAGEADEGSGNVLVGYGTGAPAARRRRVRPKDFGGPGSGAAASSGRRPGAEGTEPAQADSGRRGAATPGGGRGPAPAEGLLRGASGPGRAGEPGTAGAGGPYEAGPEIWQSLDEPSGHAREHSRPDDSRGPGDRGAEGPVAVISPLVRRLAREYGLDLRRLSGSGPDGLILRADVESAARRAADETARGFTGAYGAASGAAAPYAPAGTTGPAAPYAVQGPMDADPREPGAAELTGRRGPGHGSGPRRPGLSSERVPLRGVRGAVADKLSRSRSEIPDATTWVDADATELLAARAAMNAAGGPKVSLLALFARICTAALTRHPELNSTVDMASREVVRLPAVHMGFAAQTDRGLMVPVVREAHRLGAAELSEEFARLTEVARAGRLTPAELTGGTFTLNNYGVFGVDGSTPIINHPEAAMLGVGRIVPKPWVHEGELAVRRVVQLSLTFDHRVCDGGTAGGFLRYVADCVEQPAVLLRTL